MRFSFLLLLFLLLCLGACREHLKLGKEAAEQRLQKTLNNNDDVVKAGKFLIEKEEEAVTIAEAYLFSAYGEDKIKNERPYEVFLIDHFWVMNGTLPVGMDGGNFEIIIET